MACGQMVDHLLEVYLHAVFLGSHIHMPGFVDAEIVHTPSFDVV